MGLEGLLLPNLSLFVPFVDFPGRNSRRFWVRPGTRCVRSAATAPHDAPGCVWADIEPAQGRWREDQDDGEYSHTPSPAHLLCNFYYRLPCEGELNSCNILE